MAVDYKGAVQCGGPCMCNPLQSGHYHIKQKSKHQMQSELVDNSALPYL